MAVPVFGVETVNFIIMTEFIILLRTVAKDGLQTLHSI